MAALIKLLSFVSTTHMYKISVTGTAWRINIVVYSCLGFRFSLLIVRHASFPFRCSSSVMRVWCSAEQLSMPIYAPLILRPRGKDYINDRH